MSGALLSACEWMFGARPLSRIVSALAASGYDAIEIVGEPGRKDVARLERLTAAAGLRISGTTVHSRPLDERDLAHPEREARRHAVAYYQGCVELAARLGAPAIGLLPSAEGRFARIAGYRREWKLAVAAAREVALFAGERSVAVAVEPLNRYETFLVNTVDQALSFVHEIGVDGVGLVADLFHMNIEEADSRRALREAAPLLLELHLADSNRLGLGHGQLPLEDLLAVPAQTGFSGVFVLELGAPDVEPFLAESAAVVRRLISPCTR